MILDNELNYINVKHFINEKEIQTHNKPDSHTGNADIERFHSS